jgi:hypothetical protein
MSSSRSQALQTGSVMLRGTFGAPLCQRKRFKVQGAGQHRPHNHMPSELDPTLPAGVQAGHHRCCSTVCSTACHSGPYPPSRKPITLLGATAVVRFLHVFQHITQGCGAHASHPALPSTNTPSASKHWTHSSSCAAAAQSFAWPNVVHSVPPLHYHCPDGGREGGRHASLGHMVNRQGSGAERCATVSVPRVQRSPKPISPPAAPAAVDSKWACEAAHLQPPELLLHSHADGGAAGGWIVGFGWHAAPLVAAQPRPLPGNVLHAAADAQLVQRLR